MIMRLLLLAISLCIVHFAAHSKQTLTLFETSFNSYPPTNTVSGNNNSKTQTTNKNNISILPINASLLKSAFVGDSISLNLPNYAQFATIDKKISGQFDSETLFLRSLWKGVPLLSAITISENSVFMTLSFPNAQYSAVGDWNSVAIQKDAPLALSNRSSSSELPTDIVSFDTRKTSVSESHQNSSIDKKSTLAKFPQRASRSTPLESIQNIPTFDLLVLYTSNALEDMNNDPFGFIDHRIAYTNEVFLTSGINVQVNAAATMEVTANYDNMDALINDLIYQAPPFTGIAQERDRLGVDAVTAIFASSQPFAFAVGGVATNYSHFTPNNINDGHYSVVGSKSNAHVFAHEIGHNLGLGHSRDAGDFGSNFDFGVGYRVPLPSSDGFNTIMAYDTTETTLIPYFSSPHLKCGDIPCGVTESDNDFGSHAVEAVNRVVNIATRTGALNEQPLLVTEALSLIEDPKLKQCLQAKISTMGEIKFAAELKELVCSTPGVSRLTGLSEFSGLRKLEIYQADVSDITELSYIRTLHTLWLDNSTQNNIIVEKGFTDLANLTGLSLLFLGNVGLTDEDAQSIVNALPQLYTLSLRKSALTEAPTFSNHPNLTNLYLVDSNINEIDGLLNLSALKELDLSGNSSLTLPTEGFNFPLLTTLRLDTTGITNLDALSRLSALEYLSAQNNEISDMQGIRALTKLRNINLRGNKLTSLAFGDWAALEVLNVANNQIINPSVPSLPNLMTLNLSASEMNNLEFVRNLPNLLELHLGNVGTASLDVLTNLSSLTTLTIEEAENINNDNWPSLPSLEKLTISGIKQDNINFVSTMPRLTSFRIERSPDIKDISGLFLLPFLNEVVFYYQSDYLDNKPYCWQVDYLKNGAFRSWRNFQLYVDYGCNEEDENRDFDGDGRTNRKELDEGTDPTSNNTSDYKALEVIGEISPVYEGEKTKIGLVRKGNASSSISVAITTEDGSAKQYTDYTPVQTSLTFQAGERFKIIEVQNYSVYDQPKDDKTYKVHIEGISPFSYTATTTVTIAKQLQDFNLVKWFELPAVYFNDDYRYFVSNDNFIVTLRRDNITNTSVNVELNWDELSPGSLQYISNPPQFVEFAAGEKKKEIVISVNGIEEKNNWNDELYFVSLRLKSEKNQYHVYNDSASITLVLGKQNNLKKRSVHDINHNGQSDLVFYRHTNNSFVTSEFLSEDIDRHIMKSNGEHVIPFMAFLDGNAEPDLLLFSPDSHIWSISTSKSEIDEQIYFGDRSGDIPVPADYNGDGLTDIAVARPTTGHWIIKFTGTNTIFRKPTRFRSGFIPTVSDFDGDGIDDIGYRNPKTGMWSIYYSGGFSHASNEGGSFGSIYFGSQEEDIPVHGDFDGDGIDDIAIRRPSIGSFFIKYSSTSKIYRTFFGAQATDIPVVEDYDGDGKADIAVRRDSQSGIYILSSKNNHIQRRGFGSNATDIFTASPIMTKIEKLSLLSQGSDLTNKTISYNDEFLNGEMIPPKAEEVEIVSF
ncbi:hypothetical protein EYR97_20500 [Alteromonas sp. KUL42]|nr:hypothetical protein EYR97_20500 [Alteromonas sp. KUL42]